MVYTDAQLARLLAACRSASRAAPEGPKEPDDLDHPPASATRQQTAKTLRRQQQNGGWRAIARQLEQEFPGEFGPPPERSGSGSRAKVMATTVSVPAPAPENRIKEGTDLDHQPEQVKALPVSPPAPPILPLERGFWQGVLYGNPDALIPGPDATRALQLVSDKLGIPTVTSETLGTLRAAQLRKLLRERFGPVQVEEALAALWRSAPTSSGAPVPGEDQSRLPPGPMPEAGQPRWIRDLHNPDRIEREWLLDLGIG